MKKQIILLAVLIFALTGCTKKAEVTTPTQEASTQATTAQTQTEFTLMQEASSKAAAVQTASMQPTATANPTDATPTAVSTVPTTANSATEVVPSKEPTTQEIQQALHNANLYSGKIDGDLGSKTKKAIKDFQEQNGLKADGKVGKKTWAKLQPFLNKEAEPTISKD